MTDPRRCVAVADYVAKEDDELTFNKGDIIFVPKRTNEERWQGVCNGKVGWFPRVYVDDKTVEVKAGKTTRVRAIRDYEAVAEEELSFPKGAVMFVVARESEKYWRGVYEGKSGLILAANVEDASEKEQPKSFEGAKCRAIRSHIPTTNDELAFKVGDTVFVPHPDKTLETWKGVCKGEIGTFPASKVADTKEHTEEELEKLIEENSKLTDEEAAAEALAKREAAKKLALEKKTALTKVDDAEVEAVAQEMKKQTVTSEPSAANEEEERKGAKDESTQQGDDVPAPTPAAMATTTTTATNEEEKPKDDGEVAEEAAPAQDAVTEQAADEFAGLSEKERKALEKKKAKEEKKRAKEEAKKKKQV
ncbi:hypothetical protein PTSG_11992 [Salpingoeca rosetta]|uniref:SH3 domain-containing protein n=1 Tax=Salpingoeca rosetta (strain ATCC 50818 / BSB-021) TaxID=946362 RepID=F2U4R8_SALR5|nr:uncharacterized protein PTSG_11992 [Salpingoeca rosetta]EGD82634.1 hypothetical protein PTSG_11992 [Salpingoeca rosetta]|eukprot:XP_004995870.1 hypothetical protein PTSG_11992 [Salpingoeca rosetta]